jgi:hypothetical protein
MIYLNSLALIVFIVCVSSEVVPVVHAPARSLFPSFFVCRASADLGENHVVSTLDPESNDKKRPWGCFLSVGNMFQTCHVAHNQLHVDHVDALYDQHNKLASRSAVVQTYVVSIVGELYP